MCGATTYGIKAARACGNATETIPPYEKMMHETLLETRVRQPADVS
jgi:hypothetical protein